MAPNNLTCWVPWRERSDSHDRSYNKIPPAPRGDGGKGITKLNTFETQCESPRRWNICFTVTGDLRFLSHHDMMRLMERVTARAALPLRYSQGFNPRPGISLPVPRPVGVASLDERLIIRLEEDISATELLERLNRHSPEGLEFLRAGPIDGKASSLPGGITYCREVTPSRAGLLRARLDELQSREAWCVQRRVKQKQRGRRNPRSVPATRPLDIKPRVADLGLDDTTLHFTCIPLDGVWARPGEILQTLGLGQPEELALLVRTKIHEIDSTTERLTN